MGLRGQLILDANQPGKMKARVYWGVTLVYSIARIIFVMLIYICELIKEANKDVRISQCVFGEWEEGGVIACYLTEKDCSAKGKACVCVRFTNSVVGLAQQRVCWETHSLLSQWGVCVSSAGWAKAAPPPQVQGFFLMSLASHQSILEYD